MIHSLRYIFFTCIVRPVILLVIGLNVRNHKRLPDKGPAIIVANHNSHLDTLVLMTLFPFKLLPKIQPVADLDYFTTNRFMAWFSTKIIGIIPLARHKKSDNDTLDSRLSGIYSALDRGQILILFPEGSRGQPEKMAKFKFGIAYIASNYPQVPIYPLFLHGLGKVLPKGEFLLVPFFCDVFVGEPMYWRGTQEETLNELRERIINLEHDVYIPDWD